MTILVGRPFSSTEGLTPEQQETLRYFVYDPVDDRLEASKPIVTTLSSLSLGDQWNIQSGGYSVYFTDLSTGDHTVFMESGVKDQSNPANHGPEGVIQPRAKIYGDNLIPIESGTLDTGSVDFIRDASVIPFSASIYSLRTIVTTPILPTEYITYAVYNGNDASGTQIFEQQVTGFNLAVGDELKFYFEQPVDTVAGEVVSERMFVADDSDGTNSRILTVRNISELPAEPYTELELRTFEYKAAMFEGIPYNGIADYNDAATAITPIPLVADTWTTLTNDGLGPATNLNYLPRNVTQMVDTSTGQFDFSQLQLGDNVLIRNAYVVTPNTNNALLELRYQIGTPPNNYTLEKVVQRLDSGSGKPYPISLGTDMIYMGDSNTKDNPITLQIKLSSNGSVVNQGTAFGVTER